MRKEGMILIILKYRWALYLVFSVFQTIGLIIYHKRVWIKYNPKIKKIKPQYLMIMYGCSLIPYISIFCYNHNFLTAFIVFTLVNAVYSFIGLSFSVSGLTKIRLILLLILIVEIVLTIVLTCGIHTDAVWIKFMLGIDIGSIFTGSIFSVYVCCAIHDLHYTSIG